MVQMKIDFIGGDLLDKALRELRKEVGEGDKNHVASALRAAGKDTVLATMKMKANAHRKTGRLADNLTIKKHPNPKRWSELYGVGVHKLGSRPRKGEADDGDLPWYANIVEYGGRGKSGPLKGFMRRSLEDNRDSFVGMFRIHLSKKIERAAKKIGATNAQQLASRARGVR